MEENKVIETQTTSESKSMNFDIINFVPSIVNFAAALIIASTVIFAATMINQRVDEGTKQLKSGMENIRESIGKIQINTSANQTAETPQVKVTQDQVNSVMSSAKLVFGNKDAKLKLIEFTDPSCPYCHVANGKNTDFNKTGNFATVENGGSYIPAVPEMKKLVDAGKAQMAILYTPGHGNGEVAMQGWFCANEKGKFWEVHEKTMTKEGYDLVNNVIKNDTANAAKFAEFVKDIVDPTFMTDCIKSEKYKTELTKGQQLASEFGVQGTPGFFVGTTPFNGAYGWDQMKSVADSLM